MYNVTIRIFNYFSSVTAISLFLFACIKFYENPNLLLHPEFFINYKAGLIRRGLDGSMLLWISNTMGVPFTNIIKFYNVCTFVIFVALLIYLKIKSRIPSYLLFSMSTLMLYLVFLEKGLRKDHIVLIFVILQYVVLFSKKFLSETSKRILFLIISILAILIHEVFFLITLVPNLITIWILSNGERIRFWKNFCILLPSFSLFIAVVTIWRGDAQQVETIIKSYDSLVIDLSYLYPLFTKSFYFWEMNYHLKANMQFLFFIFLHAVFVFAGMGNDLVKSAKLPLVLIATLAQVLVVVFLSMIAVDYARWVFISFTSIVLFLYLLNLRKSKPVIFAQESVLILRQFTSFLRYVPFLLYFILTMPYSYWNGFTGLSKYNLITKIIANFSKS